MKKLQLNKINDINNIILKYLFNYCIICHDENTTWEEQIRIRRLSIRYICSQCRTNNINRNLKREKVRKVLGIN